MTYYTHYKFETNDGLPPAGEVGLFFGFDAEGHTWLLKWSDKYEGFMACGFEPDRKSVFRNMLIKHDNEHKDFIQSWAAAPLPYPEKELAT